MRQIEAEISSVKTRDVKQAGIGEERKTGLDGLTLGDSLLGSAGKIE